MQKSKRHRRASLCSTSFPSICLVAGPPASASLPTAPTCRGASSRVVGEGAPLAAVEHSDRPLMSTAMTQRRRLLSRGTHAGLPIQGRPPRRRPAAPAESVHICAPTTTDPPARSSSDSDPGSRCRGSRGRCCYRMLEITSFLD